MGYKSSTTKAILEKQKKENTMKKNKEKALKQPLTIKVKTLVQLTLVFVALTLSVTVGYILGQVQSNEYHNQVVREANMLVRDLSLTKQQK